MGTAAKSNFEKATGVHNQASRIMIGALLSTPIQAMDTLTGFQTLESRRDTKILTQSAKFKRVKDHPMHSKMSEPTKCQLKRSNFFHQASRLERQDPDLMQQPSKPILTHSTLPVWKREELLEIRDSIPSILREGTKTEAERKAVTVDYVREVYPLESWTTRNGGGGIVIKLNDGNTIHHPIPTGKYSTNYNAEAEARGTAASTRPDNTEAIHTNVMTLSP